MKTMKKVLLGILVLGFTASANAEVVQVWKCTLADGKTGAELETASSAWLAVAKSMKGGADLKAYHEFPLAAQAGQGGFNFVLIAPDAATWGEFSDNYDDSAAAKADADWNKVATCSGSSLWNSNVIK